MSAGFTCHTLLSSPLCFDSTNNFSLQSDETAFDLFRRIRNQPILTGFSFFDTSGGLKPGDMLELTGPSGSGKTEMLYRMIANVTLSNSSSRFTLGGQGFGVIIVDLDSRFSISRLESHMLSYIRMKLIDQHVTEEDINNFFNSCEYKRILQDSLQRVHIFSCIRASLDLVLVLRRIKKLLSNNSSIRLLAIDNIGAFFWTSQKDDRLLFYDKIVASLTNLLSDHILSIVVTKPAFFENRRATDYIGKKYLALISSCVELHPRKKRNHDKVDYSRGVKYEAIFMVGNSSSATNHCTYLYSIDKGGIQMIR